MKRLLSTLGIGVFALSLQAQTPTVPATGVVGTAHDLSATGLHKQTDYTQVCKFCHSPHGANSGAAQLVPLWGHKNTTATFTMYGTPGSATNPNSQLKTTTIDAQPSGPSLACLSCHDGTVAVNARYSTVRPNYGNFNTTADNAADFNVSVVGGKTYGTLKTHTVGAPTLDANGNVTAQGDLSTVHPIGVKYEGEAAELWATPKAGVKLFNGMVQCASCHDAHNYKGAAGTSTGAFLRLTTDGSTLCLACHNK